MDNFQETSAKGDEAQDLEKLKEEAVKRAQIKLLQKNDPVRKQEEKGLEQIEHTPMDPPSAYNLPGAVSIASSEFAAPIHTLVEEHKKALAQIDDFEKALLQFKTNGYKLDQKINETFGAFFKFFDNELLAHNSKEEKFLFPVLHKKLIQSGEHSTGEKPMTAIDIMEDDHVKFIQLGTLSFNLMGLATRISDPTPRIFVLDTAYENSRELIELLKLHIYREDYTLFPLAQKLLSSEDFDLIAVEMNAF